MKLESLLLEARTHVTSYRLGTQAAIDMGLTDRSAISETFCLELLREVFELPHLQDLNAERSNAPGLDLDDGYRVPNHIDVGSRKGQEDLDHDDRRRTASEVSACPDLRSRSKKRTVIAPDR